MNLLFSCWVPICLNLRRSLVMFICDLFYLLFNHLPTGYAALKMKHRLLPVSSKRHKSHKRKRRGIMLPWSYGWWGGGGYLVYCFSSTLYVILYLLFSFLFYRYFICDIQIFLIVILQDCIYLLACA